MFTAFASRGLSFDLLTNRRSIESISANLDSISVILVSKVISEITLALSCAVDFLRLADGAKGFCLTVPKVEWESVSNFGMKVSKGATASERIGSESINRDISTKSKVSL